MIARLHGRRTLWRGRHLTVGVMFTAVMDVSPTLRTAALAPEGSRASTHDSAARAVVSMSALAVGEHLTYDVKFGALKVGTGAMRVTGIEDVRGRAAWHTAFTIKGGIPLYKVDDRMESWIDTATFSSLRFVQESHEGRRHRLRRYEMFPERGEYVEERAEPVNHPTVEQPLDEAAFLYFLRTVPLVVGERYDFNRYFKPDRNPITLQILRRERIEVPAGTFETIVVRPIIKSKGIFSENGQAEVWLTDDARHVVVQMKAKLAFGSISLHLRGAAGTSTPGAS
jgi:hypothetical protein